MKLPKSNSKSRRKVFGIAEKVVVIEFAEKVLVIQGYKTMSIIFKTEYYEPKLDKWVSFWSGTLDECMNKLGYPIIGDVPQRVAKYEKSGVRKIKYKLLSINYLR